MPALDGWERLVVEQERPATGCIPTGYQVILRAAGVAIDEVAFQREFDLDRDLTPAELEDPAIPKKNNFHCVRDAIHGKYPNLRFEIRCFDVERADEKIELIDQQLARGLPTLVSLPVNRDGSGWRAHIFLAIGSDPNTVLFFDYVHPTEGPQTQSFSKEELRKLHRMFPGKVNDVAFLASY